MNSVCRLLRQSRAQSVCEFVVTLNGKLVCRSPTPPVEDYSQHGMPSIRNPEEMRIVATIIRLQNLNIFLQFYIFILEHHDYCIIRVVQLLVSIVCTVRSG